MNTENPHPRTHSPDTEHDLSEAVVAAVADAMDISVLEVSPPLYEVLDPDALEAAVDSMTDTPDERPGRIEFAYSGFEVTVTAQREVSVAPLDAHQSPAITEPHQ